MNKIPVSVPKCAQEAIYAKTGNVDFLNQFVTGYNWNKGIDYEKLLASYITTGFQATNFGLAVEEVNKMISCRNLPVMETADQYVDPNNPQLKMKNNCTIFLGYTSNIVSSGLRDTIRFLVQHKMVDCIVTTAGGIEEDFIKCLAPTYIGDFSLDGKKLREKAVNRTGNLLVPNDNYCKFEDWITPILDEMLSEQKEEGIVWTPSKVIERLGKKIDNEESIYYWAYKNDIPVFSPAITDGALGDVLFFQTFTNPGLVIDIVADLRSINMLAVRSINTGMLTVGSGLIKHHICAANLMRNGADYSVFINTSSEFDGSDAGARPDEAKSWGKIKKEANPVKIYAEATLVFPLLVAETFAKHHFKKQ